MKLTHNCGSSGCNATNLKLYNWRTLDERVFRKLGRALPASERKDCACAKPGAIERVLRLLQQLLLDRGLLPEVSRPFYCVHLFYLLNAAEIIVLHSLLIAQCSLYLCCSTIKAPCIYLTCYP